MPATTLLISTDASLIESVREIVDSIRGLGFRVLSHLDEVWPHLDEEGTVLVMVHLGEGEGTTEVGRLLQQIAASRLAVTTLILSDRHHPEQALALLRQGVSDYLSRPLDLGRLAYLLDVLTVRARYLAPSAHSSPEPLVVQEPGEPEPFLYLPSGTMGRFIEQVRTIAPQESTIVLTGETGTGKTRLARLIHNLSPRHEQPFLVVHCGVLASNLIESELFGHTRGAFTGAERDRVGKFAAVGRGTLLLDEIDTLPVALQAKLLRVVEERAFEPVGSNKSLPTHARLIVATNRSLEEEVAAGRFRSDLYYRLNVVGLHLPPLRDRCAVIPAIARKLVEQFAARNGRPIRGIADDAMQALEEYHWPGNIRELRNVIERAVALSPGPMIQLEDLPQTLYPAAVGMPSPVAVLSALAAPAVAGRTLDEVKEGAELTRILEALRRHKNNRLRAAAELGISRMTLYKKLHKYGLMGATGSAS